MINTFILCSFFRMFLRCDAVCHAFCDESVCQRRKAALETLKVNARISDTPRPCTDCRVDTTSIGEYYVVRPELWRAAKGKGFLCINCLEKRLQRTLSRPDFMDCPANTSFKIKRSPSLRSRLGNDDQGALSPAESYEEDSISL